MKSIVSIIAIFSLSLALVSCGGGLSEEELSTLKEAKAIHEQAYSAQKEIDELMVQLVEYRNYFQAKLANNNERESQVLDDTSTDEIKAVLVEIQSIEESLLAWKDELVEVEIPGEEHDHDHEHGDHHHHGHSDDVTPAQMLELQKEQKALIDNLKERVVRILDQAQALKSTQNIQE